MFIIGAKQMATNEVPSRITIDLTPDARQEVQRIIDATSLSDAPEFFRKAMTLLRIHVDAAQAGKEIVMINPAPPNERDNIVLPFDVRPS